MTIRIRQLQSCNIYAEGGPFLGAASSIVLPDVKHKASEHKAGDLIGTPKLPGAMEPLQATVKMNGMYEDFHAITANPNHMVSLMVRANQKAAEGMNDPVDQPVIVYLRGWFSGRKIGELQSTDATKPEYTMEVFYYRLSVDGNDVEEVDLANSVHRVNGQDILADYRANLGI